MQEFNWSSGIWKRRCDGSQIPIYGISKVDIIKSSINLRMRKCKDQEDWKWIVNKYNAFTPSKIDKILNESMKEASKNVIELATKVKLYKMMKKDYQTLFNQGYYAMKERTTKLEKSVIN